MFRNCQNQPFVRAQAEILRRYGPLEVFCTVCGSEIIFFALSFVIKDRGDYFDPPHLTSPGRRSAPGGGIFYEGLNFDY